MKMQNFSGLRPIFFLIFGGETLTRPGNSALQPKLIYTSISKDECFSSHLISHILKFYLCQNYKECPSVVPLTFLITESRHFFTINYMYSILQLRE